MSKPDIISKTSLSGIAVDPRTLERVIPESRRPDGSLRKEIKIRPGFTPQEDVQRFRGTKQQQLDKTALPKGHVIGWVPPSSTTQQTKANTAGLSKSAKKNAKRKEKRAEKTVTKIKENWEDDDDDDDDEEEEAPSGEGKQKESDAAAKEDADKQKESSRADILTEKLEKLDVR